MDIEEAKDILFHLRNINTYLDLSKDKFLIPKENIVNWKEATETVLNELEKKDKVIDLMAAEIAYLNYEVIGDWCKRNKCENFKKEKEFGLTKCDTNNLDCIKQYFYKEASEE